MSRVCSAGATGTSPVAERGSGAGCGGSCPQPPPNLAPPADAAAPHFLFLVQQAVPVVRRKGTCHVSRYARRSFQSASLFRLPGDLYLGPEWSAGGGAAAT